MSTHPKDEILQKVKDLLGEHFSSYVLTVEMEIEEDGDDFTRTLTFWRGRFNAALGLAKRTALRLEEEARITDFGSNEPLDGDEWKEKV